MIRRILLTLAFAAIALAAAAPSASARTNYRPWKWALQSAFEVYTDGYYWPEGGLDYSGPYLALSLPAGFNPRENKWDYSTCVAASLVTALWGVIPNGEWTVDMRRFLRPFKDRVPFAAIPWHPWITDRLSPDGSMTNVIEPWWWPEYRTWPGLEPAAPRASRSVR